MESEKLVQHLPFGAYEKLSLLLRPVFRGKDWRSLAGELDFTIEEVRWLEDEKDPVFTLLNRWTDRNGASATVSRLLDCLGRLGRNDVMQDLADHIGTSGFQSFL